MTYLSTEKVELSVGIKKLAENTMDEKVRRRATEDTTLR